MDEAIRERRGSHAANPDEASLYAAVLLYRRRAAAESREAHRGTGIVEYFLTVAPACMAAQIEPARQQLAVLTGPNSALWREPE